MGQKIDQTAKLEYETERGTFSRSFFAIFNLFLYWQRRIRNGGQSGREKKKQGAASLLEKL